MLNFIGEITGFYKRQNVSVKRVYDCIWLIIKTELYILVIDQKMANYVPTHSSRIKLGISNHAYGGIVRIGRIPISVIYFIYFIYSYIDLIKLFNIKLLLADCIPSTFMIICFVFLFLDYNIAWNSRTAINLFQKMLSDYMFWQDKKPEYSVSFTL